MFFKQLLRFAIKMHMYYNTYDLQPTKGNSSLLTKYGSVTRCRWEKTRRQ